MHSLAFENPMDHDDDRRQKEPEHHHLRPMDEDGP
jgi:hypothetical protein